MEERMKFFGNASKHKVKSGPLSKPMCPKISTTRNFQSLPTLKKKKNIINNTRKVPIFKHQGVINGGDHRESIPFKKQI
jgi:hypothetical protein